MEMIKNKTPKTLQLLIILIFVAFVAWWVSFQAVVENQALSVQWFGGTYGLIALIGSFVGFYGSHKWGGLRTIVGRALAFFSLGLLAQEAGQLIYTYYVYSAKIDIPYPSWGDVAYFGSVLLYIYAAILLTKATGVRFTLKNRTYKLIAVAVPVILLAISYFVLLHNHEYDTSKPLTVFLDFGYPMGQAIYISLALVAYFVSRKLLGGVMRSGFVLIILALFAQYIADFSFIYQSSRGTYLAGKYVDLLYLISYFVMAMAMIRFLVIYSNLRTVGQTKNPDKNSKQLDN
jgi:hypothetical protein